mgnify:FL=1
MKIQLINLLFVFSLIFAGTIFANVDADCSPPLAGRSNCCEWAKIVCDGKGGGKWTFNNTICTYPMKTLGDPKKSCACSTKAPSYPPPEKGMWYCPLGGPHGASTWEDYQLQQMPRK